jgi:hypothetical protein
MSLTIGRWRTRYLANGPPSDAALRDWDEAPRRLPVPEIADTEAIICIRRLRLATRIHDDASGAQLREALDAALRRELAAALAGVAPDAGAATNVVVWRDRREALADLLHRACGGDVSRGWAWRQADLIPASATFDAYDARAAAVALLTGEPELIWPVLARLILAEAASGSLTMLIANLPAAAWIALLGLMPAPAEAAPAARDDDAAGAAIPPTDPVALALLDWARERAPLARLHRAALAALLGHALARGAPPTALHHASARRHLATIIGAESAVATASRTNLTEADAPGTAPPPRTREDTEAPPAPDLPAPDAPLVTDWGGLLFLLPLLPAVGLLQAVEHDAERLHAGLHAIGLALGAPPEDPGLRAFCGGALPRDPMPPADALVPATLAALEALLATRIGEPEDAAWLPGLCRRPALLTIEPGWIEAEFPLSSADARLRRAALDLDPGHLPWLGCVVRFRYA